MRVLCVVSHNVKHETIMFLGLKRLGVDLHVITGRKLDPDYTELVEAGIPVEIVPITKRKDKNAIQRIQEYIQSHQIKIVHAFNNKTVSNALQACKGQNVKFIAYRGIVGNVSFLNPASWTTYLNPRVDRIICVAEAIRQYLIKLRFLWLKIPTEKVVTIRKGHDMAWYTKPAADLSQFNIPSDAFTVACIANYRPRKGIEILIQSLNHLPKDAKIHIVLIGHMQHKNIIKELSRSAHQDRIHCVGHQPGAPEIQAACDVCMLPSIKREGLPKSVIEGMAYGVPAIVTNSGGSPELIEDGVNGFIIEPGSASAMADAMYKLYKNKTLREEMGSNAKHWIAEKLTTDHTINKTYQVYQDVIA